MAKSVPGCRFTDAPPDDAIEAADEQSCAGPRAGKLCLSNTTCSHAKFEGRHMEAVCLLASVLRGCRILHSFIPAQFRNLDKSPNTVNPDIHIR